MSGRVRRLWERRPWAYTGSVLLDEDQALALFSAFVQMLPVQEDPGAPDEPQDEAPAE